MNNCISNTDILISASIDYIRKDLQTQIDNLKYKVDNLNIDKKIFESEVRTKKDFLNTLLVIAIKTNDDKQIETIKNLIDEYDNKIETIKKTLEEQEEKRRIARLEHEAYLAKKEEKDKRDKSQTIRGLIYFSIFIFGICMCGSDLFLGLVFILISVLCYIGLGINMTNQAKEEKENIKEIKKLMEEEIKKEGK